MPELLIELFSEEIPARMQARAEADLARMLTEAFVAAGLTVSQVRTASGPRRLAFSADVPPASADVREAKKGPRVGAPDKAIEGFLRGAGLASIDQARVVKDPKGDFYEAQIERQGQPTPLIVAEALSATIAGFPWPKSMRSGTGDRRWVRPLQRILCAFDGKPVPVTLEGVAIGMETSGHRFHAPSVFKATHFAAYTDGLRRAYVIADRVERRAKILELAQAACAKRGLELIDDPGLVEEVTGLVEWPVPVIGDMDPAFLDLPAEVIRLTMRTHQRYFALRNPKTGALAPHFLTLANIEAKDSGAAIAKGNARVLSARLNDARFFWERDRSVPLYTQERQEKLQQIVFHAKLGSVWEKVERVRALAKELCAVTGADAALVDEAALNAKMDLVSETVGEFPELQGQIGRQLFKGHASVAAAIEDHYRPQGPSDRVPADPVAVTLALADKLDTLAGFWSIGEKPTGSGDPYALRRAALGVVRIVLESEVRLQLLHFLARADLFIRSQEGTKKASELIAMQQRAFAASGVEGEVRISAEKVGSRSLKGLDGPASIEQILHALREEQRDLLYFVSDRLKVQLRGESKRHDLVDAVFALGDDDLVRIVARVDALSAFLTTEDGKNLLAGYKRAANILAAESKKGDGVSTEWALDATASAAPAEIALRAALGQSLQMAEAAAAREDFVAAMDALAALRAPVDAFFEGVLVNDKDPAVRRNRLLLLDRFCAGVSAIADFSKIEG